MALDWRKREHGVPLCVSAGKAGCGKSAPQNPELGARLLAGGHVKSTERVDHFAKLWATFEADNAREWEGKSRLYTRRAGRGEFRITNHAVWGRNT